VKISGSQMRPSTYPQADSLLVNTSNSLSTCSQYFRESQQKIKQKNIKKIFSVYRNPVFQPLPTDALIQGVPPPKKKINTLSKTTSNANEKQTQSYRLSMLPIIKKKQSNFIKQETPLPSTRRPSIIEQTTTCPYTYAASSSSAIPCSMKLNRNTSLLPILLTSSSCLGTQPRKSHSGKCDNSNNLLDYKHLITHLPKPLVSIHPRYDQGEYGYLFKQLDHIRDNMPNSNVYQNYTRIG
jgi:coenzyme F420-reducing hydrogenase gamma subunit